MAPLFLNQQLERGGKFAGGGLYTIDVNSQLVDEFASRLMLPSGFLARNPICAFLSSEQHLARAEALDVENCINMEIDDLRASMIDRHLSGDRSKLTVLITEQHAGEIGPYLEDCTWNIKRDVRHAYYRTPLSTKALRHLLLSTATL